MYTLADFLTNIFKWFTSEKEIIWKHVHVGVVFEINGGFELSECYVASLSKAWSLRDPYSDSDDE